LFVEHFLWEEQMTALDRRSVLQGLFVASVAAATVGLALEPETAESSGVQGAASPDD
jgi:hypothetical protein